MAGRLVLRIRLGFHDHAPEQASIHLTFHQPAAHQIGGDDLSGTGEEGLEERLGERGGYGSGAFLDWYKVGGLVWANPSGAAEGSQLEN